jgi:hypothetical protein
MSGDNLVICEMNDKQERVLIIVLRFIFEFRWHFRRILSINIKIFVRPPLCYLGMTGSVTMQFLS